MSSYWVPGERVRERDHDEAARLERVLLEASDEADGHLDDDEDDQRPAQIAGARAVVAQRRRQDDPLLLQVKEAVLSVHAEFLGKSRYANQGQRVVAGQRLMQQASDIFLGWQLTKGIDGVERDSYVRQLRDCMGMS